jgi:hypothetical protein
VTTRAVWLAVMLVACSDDASGPPPVFPDNWAQTYQRVRNCRNSLEHNLRRIEVFVSPDAITPYQGRTEPFPVGSIVLKVEHDDNDSTCSEPPIGYTVMQRLADGTDPALLDWTWQELDGSRKALERPPANCVRCHQECVPPNGYLGTCTVP